VIETMTQWQEMAHAVQLALNDDWDAAHQIVQDLNHAKACWIHAVLHKIEGDVGNSRYWYARCDHEYEDYPDPKEELKVIATLLSD
jgi:hypothetical protein